MNIWDQLTPAERLMALYNASKPRAHPSDAMTLEQAELLVQHGYLDHVQGRPIQMDVSKDFDPRSYDSHNGDGAALAAITKFYKTK